MPVLALNGPTTASKPDGPSNSSWGRKDMSSSFGVSDGLSAVCKSSTCTRQMRDQLLAASSVASRGLVASPCAACLGHQAALGFVRRCNKPAAPWEASLAYSAIAFSRDFLSCLCNLSSSVSALHPGEPATRVLIATHLFAPRSPSFAGACEAFQSAPAVAAGVFWACCETSQVQLS